MKTLITKKQNNIAFSGLTEIKFSRDFKPWQSKDDRRVCNSVLVSDAFRYLLKNRDVSLEFDKFESASENKVYTVLHYKFSPLKQTTSFLNKVKNSIKKVFEGDDSVQHHWMYGWVDTKNGEYVSLVSKILDYPLDDMIAKVNKNH